MDIDKILASGLINYTELAKKLWEHDEYSRIRLSKKINRTNKQRLTEKDKKNIEEILKANGF